MDQHGRSRDSIADIEEQLLAIITSHPRSSTTPDGEPCIPSALLTDVFMEFQIQYGHPILDDSELAAIDAFVQNQPEIDVISPSMLIHFVAMKTKHSPPDSPSLTQERGRDHPQSHSRNSSEDSVRTGSRPPSRGPPQTPRSNPFDKRKRTTPLGGSAAPSSWHKPPPHRRKSDAGSRSDSEYSASPSAFRRSHGRTRAPSNPTSPHSDMYSPPGSARSPNFPTSRPGSRSGRYNNGYSSPEDDATISHEQFIRSISSLPMPRDDIDSDDERNSDDDLDLIHDRRSSTVSLEPIDKVDILTKTNEELYRKLREAEKSLLHSMNQHEAELEELQARLDEVKSELSATKREEKELRSKERMNQNQISELESEVTKLNKQLETSRANYTALNRIYQDQLHATEQHRNELRDREREIQNLRDAVSLHELEITRSADERARFEDRIHRLEIELEIASHAQEELDQQKQENLMLKETIDRMKFDIDELRNKDHWNGSHSGHSSAANTISKSLGAELSAKLGDGKWGMDDDETEEPPHLSQEIIEEEEITEGEDDEDVVQTIITRKKRKVASRANQMEKLETHTYEEVKEYSDTATQYDAEAFMRTSSSQTDPPPKVITASAYAQTLAPSVSTFAIQTDPEPEPEPVVEPERISMEIQTDEQPAEEEGGSSSSSSTVLAPTPRPANYPELPPAYGEEPDTRSALEMLKQWHSGAKLPGPNQLKLSADMAADWHALKQQLGFTCKVIDDAVDSSSPPEESSSSSSDNNKNKGKRRASGKFYNIYNTYVYDSSSALAQAGQTAAVLVGVGFLWYMNLHLTYSHPAGPTLYDRSAWHSFNTIGAAGEGFGEAFEGGSGGGSSGVVWDFLGGVAGGAARIARGWPT